MFVLMKSSNVHQGALKSNTEVPSGTLQSFAVFTCRGVCDAEFHQWLRNILKNYAGKKIQFTTTRTEILSTQTLAPADLRVIKTFLL